LTTLPEPNRGEGNVGEVLHGNEPQATDLAKPNPVGNATSLPER